MSQGVGAPQDVPGSSHGAWVDAVDGGARLAHVVGGGAGPGHMAAAYDFHNKHVHEDSSCLSHSRDSQSLA